MFHNIVLYDQFQKFKTVSPLDEVVVAVALAVVAADTAVVATVVAVVADTRRRYSSCRSSKLLSQISTSKSCMKGDSNTARNKILLNHKIFSPAKPIYPCYYITYAVRMLSV